MLRLLNLGLGFIILHILHCCTADLDLLANFKVQRTGLKTKTGDTL